jgi:hypothetical protein
MLVRLLVKLSKSTWLVHHLWKPSDAGLKIQVSHLLLRLVSFAPKLRCQPCYWNTNWDWLAPHVLRLRQYRLGTFSNPSEEISRPTYKTRTGGSMSKVSYKMARKVGCFWVQTTDPMSIIATIFQLFMKHLVMTFQWNARIFLVPVDNK